MQAAELRSHTNEQNRMIDNLYSAQFSEGDFMVEILF